MKAREEAVASFPRTCGGDPNINIDINYEHTVFPAPAGVIRLCKVY